MVLGGGMVQLDTWMNRVDRRVVNPVGDGWRSRAGGCTDKEVTVTDRALGVEFAEDEDMGNDRRLQGWSWLCGWAGVAGLHEPPWGLCPVFPTPPLLSCEAQRSRRLLRAPSWPPCSGFPATCSPRPGVGLLYVLTCNL
jgi:hypothetical protein